MPSAELHPSKPSHLSDTSSHSSSPSSPTTTACPAAPSTPPPIRQHLLHPSPHTTHHLIWDPHAALSLRNNHRLLGDLVGTLPKHLSQNQFLSLPLILSSEEAHHLHSLPPSAIPSVQTVLDGPHTYLPSTTSTVAAFRAARDHDIATQVHLSVQKQQLERRRRVPTTATKPLPPPPRPSRKRARSPPPVRTTIPTSTDAPTSSIPRACTSPSRPQRDCTQLPHEPPAKVARLGLLSRMSHGVQSALRAVAVSLGVSSPPSPRNTVIPESTDTTAEQQQPHGPSHCAPTNVVSPSSTITPTHPGTPSSPKEDIPVKNNRQDSDLIQPEQKQLSTCAPSTSQSRDDILERKMRQQARTAVLVMHATAAREDELPSSPPTFAPTSLPDNQSVSISRRARARQAVFDDLHQKGYSMSCGAKFGADFLAYAANPQLVHAALSVVVVESDTAVSARDVVALGRLGDSTRKRTVLAAPRWRADGKEGDVCQHVEYIGIQWEETLP